MPAFTVELRREYTVTAYAKVEVIASTAGGAVELALVMADTDQVPSLAFNDGEEGTTFAQTRRPGVPTAPGAPGITAEAEPLL